ELVDFDACPRRYQLRHEVGLAEFPTFVEREADGALVAELVDDPHDGEEQALVPAGLDAAERGTLAHQLLERVDLGAWPGSGRAGRAAPAESLGHDASAPAVAAVADRVAAFLDSPFGRTLVARPASVQREVPFALAVGHERGTRLLVKGQMDLVIDD